MSKSSKVLKFKKYNTAFAKLSHLILDLNEAQQVALLKKAEELFSKEKRTSPRKSCRLPVRFLTFDRIYSGHITNISPSGIFIETKKPLIVRDDILVDFSLEGVNESLRLRGVVIHANGGGPNCLDNLSIELNSELCIVRMRPQAASAKG